METKDLIKYIGIPYKFKGDSFVKGMDCVTILHAYYKEEGLDLPVPEYSRRDMNTMRLAKVYIKAVSEFAANNEVVNKVEELQINDLVCFRVSGKLVALSGVYIEKNRVLCLPHKETSVLLKLDSLIWRNKFIFGVRFK